jgi:uncharacterized protein (TIGR00106 family)
LAIEEDGDSLIIATLSIFPIGEGVSLSGYVRASLEALKKTGLRFEPGAMTTTIEAKSLDELFSAVNKAHKAQLAMGAKRIYLALTIDDRRDKEARIETKLKPIGERTRALR